MKNNFKLLLIIFILSITFSIFAAQQVITNIDTDPQGATLQIKGDSLIYKTPITLKLRKGEKYIMTFSKKGYKSQTISHIGGNGDIYVDLSGKDKVKKVKVDITSDPDNANVKIKGEDNSFKTPATVKLKKGETYKITFSKNGYESKTIEYTGGDGDIHVNLKKENVNVKVDITSDPDNANVKIKGEDNSFKTPATVKLKKGETYKITFSKNGYESKTIKYTGGEGDIHIKLKKENVNVKVDITSDPDNANVKIKGEDNSFKTPATVKLKKGETYKITFSKNGYESKTIEYTGGEGDIHIKLKKENFNVKTNITSNPDHVNVVIDGDSNTYVTPITINFKNGVEYILTFNKKGCKQEKMKYIGGDGDIHVNLKSKLLSLEINSNVKNAKVYINDEKIGSTPAKIDLKEGSYQIKIDHPDYKAYKTTIYLDSDKSIYADLDKIKKYTIKISLPNGAKIYINGEKQKLDWDGAKIKSFKFTSEKEWNEIKIKFQGLVIEKDVKFDGSDITPVPHFPPF